jgi:RNA polymerase sigma factor (sigma-70 family)
VNDEREFDQRFLAARSYLFNTLHKRFRGWNTEDLADLVQDTYVQCRQNFRSLREPAYFKSWMVTCAFNLAFVRARKASRAVKRREQLTDLTVIQEMYRQSLESPLRNVLDAERRSRVLEVVGTFSEKVQETFLLRFRDGLSFTEIAEAEGAPEPTVKTRVHRVVVELRGKIAA